jgi:hypothetical protein
MIQIKHPPTVVVFIGNEDNICFFTATLKLIKVTASLDHANWLCKTEEKATVSICV